MSLLSLFIEIGLAWNLNIYCVVPILLLKISDVVVVQVYYDSYLNFHINNDVSCCKTLKALGFFKRICNEFKLYYSSAYSIKLRAC